MDTSLLIHLVDVSKPQVLTDYRRAEQAKTGEYGPVRPPTVALRLAASIFGEYAKEGSLPMRVFAEADIQVYSGMPWNDSSALFRFTGETTVRRIADILYPRHGRTNLPLSERHRPADDLPEQVEAWLRPIPRMIESIRTREWVPCPVILLNFRERLHTPWLFRAETLCGQVPDGTHRALAYVLMAADTPDEPVRVRVLSIHPCVLGLLNCATLALRFIADPGGTPAFARRRFAGSALLAPLDPHADSATDPGSEQARAGNPRP